MMKYRNRETGVILEPASDVAEATFAADERYEAMAAETGEKPVARRRKGGEAKEEQPCM